MRRSSVSLAKNPNRNIPGIIGTAIPAAFCDVVRVELPTHAVLYISGKLATDAEGNIVSASFEEQCDKTLQNIREVLTYQGATMDNIVRTLIFVTDLSDENLRILHEVRGRYFSRDAFPASTLVECTKLVRPGGKIEIEAEAIIPA
ncbi:RidA family protein [Nitratireductor sp. CAU 1489]|uniref:RidA family protein n=1 Tax=Nitratireductor arenosus TaxID=2682096 RepID=A0A844QDY4_9HYPH|nr:RidA family protein [Nitratireductor arenosus]MVA96240.1 RidA family protein [Nitratireductor arenosus]